MKKILLLLLFWFSCYTLYSQQLIWEQNTASSTKYPVEYVALPDGGFAALYRENIFDASLSRLDSLGDEVWSHPFPIGMRLADFNHSMLKVVPGGLLVGLQQANPDTVKLALVKINWQGSEIWTKTISTDRKDNAISDMFIKSANEYVLLASGRNSNQILSDGGGAKFMALGIDSLGNKTWHKTYTDPLGTICTPRYIIPYRPDAYILTGNTSVGGTAPRLIKIGAEGEVLQDTIHESIPESSAYQTNSGNFIPVSDGNVVFTGFHNTPVFSDRFILVSKIDTSLNVLWTVMHSEAAGNFGSSNVLELADSTILLVTQQQNGDKIILLKISPQGQVLDTSYVSVSHTTYANGLVNSFLLPDSSLIYGGTSFMAKIGGVGLPMPPPVPADTTDTLVSVVQQFLPALSGLGTAYPNPANSTITIPYNLPMGTATATIQIAEVATGRLVSRLTLDLKSERVEIPLVNLSSGLYSYTLLLDGVPSGTKKLVVIR